MNENSPQLTPGKNRWYAALAYYEINGEEFVHKAIFNVRGEFEPHISLKQMALDSIWLETHRWYEDDYTKLVIFELKEPTVTIQFNKG